MIPEAQRLHDAAVRKDERAKCIAEIKALRMAGVWTEGNHAVFRAVAAALSVTNQPEEKDAQT